MSLYYIVMGGTLYGQGRTPESALEDAITYGVDDMTADDLINNTQGKRHQVTNLDVVLTDTLAGVYVP
tara:strand:- start:165 stop:368 length:204 start_codon:yes stop_codon:yes gene_type:complete